MEKEEFSQSFEYDAMNRLQKETKPNKNTISYNYNKASLLESVHGTEGAELNQYVRNIDYNEKGQRKSIQFGNNSAMRYLYDKKTFRLTNLVMLRDTMGGEMMDLAYTYDPVGNIIGIVDSAQQTQYFNNHQIDPKGTYEYDALYFWIPRYS